MRARTRVHILFKGFMIRLFVRLIGINHTPIHTCSRLKTKCQKVDVVPSTRRGLNPDAGPVYNPVAFNEPLLPGTDEQHPTQETHPTRPEPEAVEAEWLRVQTSWSRRLSDIELAEQTDAVLINDVRVVHPGGKVAVECVHLASGGERSLVYWGRTVRAKVLSSAP